MSTGILDQVRVPRSRSVAPDETDRRRNDPERGDPERTRTERTRTERSRTERSRTGRGRESAHPERVREDRASARRSGTSAPGRAVRGGQRADAARPRSRDESRTGGTAPFVLLIMVLLTSGLVATLWLSTAAAADSYRLDAARQHARDLSEQTERLHRDVEAARSAPSLAAAAAREGMVPAGEPAVLLVAPNGSTRVIGSPRAARAAPAVPPPSAAPRPPAPRAVADPEVAAQTGADRAASESPTPAGSPTVSPTGTDAGAAQGLR